MPVLSKPIIPIHSTLYIPQAKLFIQLYIFFRFKSAANINSELISSLKRHKNIVYPVWIYSIQNKILS